jgi:hypothetical protein
MILAEMTNATEIRNGKRGFMVMQDVCVTEWTESREK